MTLTFHPHLMNRSFKLNFLLKQDVYVYESIAVDMKPVYTCSCVNVNL